LVKYKWTPDLIPKPIDPINGLIMASGHYMIHFAFFVSIFFVKEAKENIVCYNIDDSGLMASTDVDLNLNNEI
jgi:hypothetical protein